MAMPKSWVVKRTYQGQTNARCGCSAWCPHILVKCISHPPCSSQAPHTVDQITCSAPTLNCSLCIGTRHARPGPVPCLLPLRPIAMFLLQRVHSHTMSAATPSLGGIRVCAVVPGLGLPWSLMCTANPCKVSCSTHGHCALKCFCTMCRTADRLYVPECTHSMCHHAALGGVLNPALVAHSGGSCGPLPYPLSVFGKKCSHCAHVMQTFGP